MMEPLKTFNIEGSLKNIPTPSRTGYIARLTEMTESVIKRMRWKAFFYLRGEEANLQPTEEKYGFKARKCPPQVEEMRAFEEDMAKMIETISFRKVSNTFQDKLKRDVERVKKSNDVLVQADKTRNIYAVSKDQYSKLLHDNVTKHYKHAPERAYDEINTEARQLTASIGIACLYVQVGRANLIGYVQTRLEFSDSSSIHL